MTRTQTLSSISIGLLALSCVLVQSCAPTPEVLPRATRGYILISLDTLRADHLGCYGYPRATSPFLDGLAERSALFERAIAQYPSTLTSHMSMFTGLYPGEHGVYPPDSVLSEELETVPEVFQRSGYRTAAFTEGGYVRGRYGFRRGFDEFVARDRRGPREVERTFERGLRFLRGLEAEDRFFLFLHTYAVHAPYDPVPPYREQFWDRPVPETFVPTGPNLSRHNATGGRLSPEVVSYFKALYDGSIRHLDDVLAGFFAELETLGLSREVTVIVTSDHGEEFQEHGLMNHTQLYDEVMRVPLLIHHPDLPGSRHPELVQSIDLAPTLYRLARLEPTMTSSGRSLTGFLTGAGDDRPPAAYAEADLGRYTLYRRESEGLFQLLTFLPAAPLWVTRTVKLDLRGEELAFEARSFAEPRQLTAHLDGVAVDSWPLDPDWRRLKLTVPAAAAGKRTVELTVDGCAFERPDEPRNAGRCLGFQLRAVPLARAELFELLEDPAAARDLSPREERRARRLVRELEEYRQLPPRATGVTQELDPELESQLKSLGYLQ